MGGLKEPTQISNNILDTTVQLLKFIGKSPCYDNYGYHSNSIIDAPPVLLKCSASALTRDWNTHFDALLQHLILKLKILKKIWR
ncbi:hypothetical protein PIROE2DRAFT_6349 [Piromyces sp. E2]|nr:hypothetical protein PIROE2DRAFT_6349 [Piromyces sp. E2]|eukprot:OUM66408.1 hypothetical protein PIROE2DRAFT_6349 [Piromyces sp. E2]